MKLSDVIGSNGGSTEQDANPRAEIKSGQKHRIGL
jgi:hypothetical protein